MAKAKTKSRIGSNYTLPHRRKREGRTNYKKRLAYLKSGNVRLVIRPTSRNIVVQLVRYAPQGDQVLSTVTAISLKQYGWRFYGGNMPSAYLCGFLLAKRGKDKVKGDVIVDLGLSHAAGHTRVSAAIKGAVDGGLQVITDTERLPADERVRGSHIQAYAQSLGGQTRQFSAQVKAGAMPDTLVTVFDTVKKKIIGA